MSLHGIDPAQLAKLLAPAPGMPPAVYSLRLDPELKRICRRAHLPVGGRKSEVLSRIEYAWQHNPEPIRTVVRELLQSSLLTSSGGLMDAPPSGVPANHNSSGHSSTSGRSKGGGSSGLKLPDALLVRVPGRAAALHGAAPSAPLPVRHLRRLQHAR